MKCAVSQAIRLDVTHNRTIRRAAWRDKDRWWTRVVKRVSRKPAQPIQPQWAERTGGGKLPVGVVRRATSRLLLVLYCLA